MSNTMFVAQAAQNEGVKVGHAKGMIDGKRRGREEGKTEGWNSALSEMQQWVDHARGLEEIFAVGGLKRLWMNKVAHATRPRKLKDSPLKDRRNIFLHMLAYAEYHQTNVADFGIMMNKMSDHQSMVADDLESGQKTTEETIAIMRRLAKATQGKGERIVRDQKDDTLKEWISFRVKTLESHVKYSSKKGIIPDQDSIPRNETLVAQGYEISNDKFDIVTDAKKFLGEKRDVASFGY